MPEVNGSKNLYLYIEHIIPSINIFPLDLVYGLGDAIREYDYLVFTRISTPNGSTGRQLFLAETIHGPLNRELPKIVRNAYLNQHNIVWAHYRVGDYLNYYTPLNINLPRSVIEALDHEMINKYEEIYTKIYWIGYELYLLLYYIALYIQPKALDLDFLNYLSVKCSNSQSIYCKYIQCYNEHVKLVNIYRNLSSRMDNIESLKKCIEELYRSIRGYDISLKARIESCLKKDLSKIVVIVLPQLHGILTIGDKRERQEEAISKRVKYQNIALEKIYSLLKGICENVKLFIVAYGWRNRLGNYYEEYIRVLKGGLEDKDLKILPDSNQRGVKEVFNEINSYLDSDTGLIILVLSDYMKDFIRESISMNWRTHRRLLMIIPEIGFVPNRLDSLPDNRRETTSRKVLARQIYIDPGKHEFFHRIYVKCLDRLCSGRRG